MWDQSNGTARRVLAFQVVNLGFIQGTICGSRIHRNYTVKSQESALSIVAVAPAPNPSPLQRRKIKRSKWKERKETGSDGSLRPCSTCSVRTGRQAHVLEGTLVSQTAQQHLKADPSFCSSQKSKSPTLDPRGSEACQMCLDYPLTLSRPPNQRGAGTHSSTAPEEASWITDPSHKTGETHKTG